MSDSESEDNQFENVTGKELAQKMKKKTYDDEAEIVYDEILSQLFERVPPGEGDEFAAVKPWLGAIKEPKSHPKPNAKAPEEDLEIDWVYGYRSEEARQNLFFNEIGQAVYPTAALGVIYDYKQQKQTYFGGGKTDFEGRRQNNDEKEGHNDDVTALCVSYDRKIVATGQNGQKPIIYVWDASTGEVICKKRLPKGSRLVTAIGISANNKFIVATDAAEKVTSYVFEIEGSANPIADSAINAVVTHLQCHPKDDMQYSTCGKKHLVFCTIGADKKSVKQTKGKKFDNINMAAVAFSAQNNGTSYGGGADGQVYQFSGDTVSKVYKNNKGSIYTIACKPEGNGEIVLVGGSDKTITCYNSNGGALKQAWVVKTESPPRSIDLQNGKILLGFKNGNISEMDMASQAIKPVMFSHCDGECWGLELCHLPDGSFRVISSADDNRILAYDPQSKRVLCQGSVQVAAPKKKKKEKTGYRGGASSMSSKPAEQQSRCVAYCPQNGHLAVSDNKGIVTIRNIDWNAVDQGREGALDDVKKTLCKGVKKAEWIETMVFSPDGKYLAIGSHDNFIYVLSTKDYSEKGKKFIKLTGHSSFITCLDWSLDSKWLRSNCGAYELLFFNMETVKRDPSGASNTVDVVWADQTCKLGWNVQGIFPSGCDGSHVNTVAMTKGEKLIASGDDYGLVNLYRNPILEKSKKGGAHKSNKYMGHSEHVTTVKFSNDNKFLFSAGGQD